MSTLKIRWLRYGIFLVVLAASAAGCDLPGQPKVEDRYVAPAMEKTFQSLFKQNCVGCHGEKGDFGPAPPLNDKLFHALIPDDELKRVISEGRLGTLMPAFAKDKGGHLTDEQVNILADGIKSLGGAAEPVPSGSPAYLLGERQKRPVGNGAKVFGRACASCHGDNGLGTKTMGPINNASFLALNSDQALRRYVITGRLDLGMPNYADSKGRGENFTPLTDQEVTDLVGLLASWRKGGSDSGRGN